MGLTLSARLALTLAAFLTATALCAQSVQVAPGPEYRASGWHELWFGHGYRDLWTTPATFAVLDLAHEAGGLTPVRQVGQLQTAALALKGTDGRSYTFRSLEKEPERVLPIAWRDTWPARITRDLTSSTHPAAAVILPRLADAAQVPNTHPRLVAMPDDPALGQFRKTFGGRLGTFEVYPTPGPDGTGFLGATALLSTQQLWQQWLAGPANRVDSRAFLRARILDLFVHNYDRHRGQWRWARIAGKPLLVPVPEDPDMCFLRYDGLALSMIRNMYAKLPIFEPKYPGRLDGVLTSGSEVDRWLLTDLDRSAFRQEAAEVKRRLTDVVIDEAARSMPPEWHAIDGPRLTSALRRRRDALVQYIDRVYLYLARAVDVHATDRDELVSIRHDADGSVQVTLALLEAGRAHDPYFKRRFVPDETHDIRIYLHGGNDRVVAEGGHNSIDVKIIAGAGTDAIDDRQGGGSQVWAGEGRIQVLRGPGTDERQSPWVNPAPVEDAPWLEPRNFGHWTMKEPKLWWSPDLDVLLGAGLTRTGWGFRKYPYASMQTVQGLFSTGEQSGLIDYVGIFRKADSGFSGRIWAHGSGIDHFNFFGFGNETPHVHRELYRTKQTTYSVSPALRYEAGQNLLLSAGGDVRYSDSVTSGVSVLGQLHPYGVGKFGTVGLRAAVEFDSRGRGTDRSLVEIGGSSEEVRPQISGLRLRGAAFYRPAVWDVKSGYGGIEGMLAGYVGSRTVVLAMRVGGRQVYGQYPWFDAAFLGGPSDRGFRFQRFAGDSSLYGSAELRLWLGKVGSNVLPLRLGLFGFADTGRVWLEGETSDRWHDSYGAGLLFQPISTPLIFRARVAHSADGAVFYLGSGFAF
jgi:hypothetical protein